MAVAALDFRISIIMCLSIKVKRPECILSEGEHAGYQFTVVHNGLGHRCGYVRVPKGHPWHRKDYDDVQADVHGGLTFSEPDVPCDHGGPYDAYWLGFDCAHLDDAADPALPGSERMGFSRGVVRTQEYVEGQCRSLCEQAAQAAQP